MLQLLNTMRKGLLTKKTSTKGEFVQLDYDDKINKITKVVNNEGWTTFQYDKLGNLSKAVNSSGKSVLLIYDRMGKITKMIDQEKETKNPAEPSLSNTIQWANLLKLKWKM